MSESFTQREGLRAPPESLKPWLDAPIALSSNGALQPDVLMILVDLGVRAATKPV